MQLPLIKTNAPRLPALHLSPAVKLAAVYLVFSAGWILLSDDLVTRLSLDAASTQRLQNIKGLLFVALSGMLLYGTSRYFYAKLQASFRSKDAVLAKLTALHEATGEGIVYYDFLSDSAEVNGQMQRFFGRQQGVISPYLTRHHQLIHPEDYQRVVDQFQDFLQQPGAVWQTEYRYRDCTGHYRAILSRGYLFRDARTRAPLHMVCALKDVTALKEVDARIHRQQIRHREAMTRSIMEAEEKERNRWAEELHDNVCQVLTAAKLHFELAARELPPLDLLTKGQGLVETALQEIRQISAAIKPPEFSHVPLRESLGDLMSNLQRLSKARFELACPCDVVLGLNPEQKLLVYRVVQEQLNNVLKYARATTARVSLQVTGGQVKLVIKDDGIGFDPSSQKTGIGFKNIRSRVQFFNGNLTVTAQPGQGCELRAEFPLC